jgi:hypothetical protein
VIVLLYLVYDPALYAIFPKCPFRLLSGLDCPGCGSQRAVHALLHGDVSRAADHNLLLLLSLPLLVVQSGHWLRAKLSGRGEPSWPLWQHRLVPYVFGTATLLFWVLRNIPARPFLYLASGN